MEKASLFEHNEIAYKKLCKMLEGHKTATVDHATGTGKSFIALKYMYENRNKRVLYLAPTYPIIDQLMDDCYKIGITPEEINVDTMIYRSLLDLDMEELYKKYDVIVFDEYHRTGAKETYKKIKQLKYLLTQSDDEKKFIGLTATPIRYLDDERNMTNEVFDGNVASKLSLSEAMLEELLPIPLYINSKVACHTQLESLVRKINRLAPSKTKDELMKKAEMVSEDIGAENEDIRKLLNRYITKKDGKYIIFCSNINELAKYSHYVKTWFKDIGDVQSFCVHSGQKKEKNKEELAKFNNAKNKLSVLLCVDILNEGVHVDDIDGVVLLRKTVSPIIYFQQIGRALSFSGRNKQITIFDLVNNFGNHNAIDAVYRELKIEMKRKILEHPENKEKYEEILGRFRIMDETKEIISQIDQILAEVTPEKVINSRVEYYTNMLVEAAKSNNKDIFSNKQTAKAYVYISNYAKYVKNEQFTALLESGIILPRELQMTLDERKSLLDGFNSFYEQEQNQNELYLDMVIDFIEFNGRLPNVNATDENEQKLMSRYLRILPLFSKEQKKKLVEVCDDKKVEYKSYEKAILGKKVSLKDIEDLVAMGNILVEDNKKLPEHLRKALEIIYFKYTVKNSLEIAKILEAHERIIEEEKEKFEKSRYVEIEGIVKLIEENPKITTAQLLDEINKNGQTTIGTREIREIRRRLINIKMSHLKKVLNDDGSLDMEVFLKTAKRANGEQLKGMFASCRKSKKTSEVVRLIIEFMKKNNGRMPDITSIDETESSLAKRFQEIENSDEIEEQLDWIQEDLDSTFYSPEKIVTQVATKKVEDAEVQIVVLKCIQFYNKKGRRPLKNSKDEEERKLAEEFQGVCVKNLTAERLEELNSMFNSRKGLRATTLEYLRNKRENGTGGREENE